MSRSDEFDLNAMRMIHTNNREGFDELLDQLSPLEVYQLAWDALVSVAATLEARQGQIRYATRHPRRRKR